MTMFKFLAAALLLGASLGQPTAQGAQIALLDSDNTEEFFRRHYAGCFSPTYFLGNGQEYQRYFRGWEYVLTKNSIPFDIIQDSGATTEGLANYKVLILSNTASLSDDQVRAIHSWVVRGGRLLATFGSGYKDITLDLREIDLLREQSGGTFGLHQLWHDPVGKIFSTFWLDPGVDVRITRYQGPTACLSGQLSGNILPYGAEGNMLIHRPDNHPDKLADLMIDNPTWTRQTPAVIETRTGQGLVVYFSFAPEYLVSKEFGLPSPEACSDGQSWTGRSEKGRMLMLCAINYLLNN